MGFPRKTYIQLSLVTLVFTILDLWTKALISKSFQYGESKTIIANFLDFTLVHNKGAAFSMGPTWSPYFFIITSLFAIGFVVYLVVRMRPDEKLAAFGLALVLSGAFGNLVDRIRFGYVVDFIDVYIPRAQCPAWILSTFGTCHWPAFNVADAAITVGAVMFGIDLLLRKKNAS